MIQLKSPLNTVSWKCFMNVNIVQDTCFVMLSITWFSVCFLCVGSVSLPLFQYFSCNLSDFINLRNIYLVCKHIFLSKCSLLLYVASTLFCSPL